MTAPIAPEHQDIYDQLVSTFPAHEVIWRSRNAGRWLDIDVGDEATSAVVTIAVKRMRSCRTKALTVDELVSCQKALAEAAGRARR